MNTLETEPIDIFQRQLDQMRPELTQAIRPHLNVDRFIQATADAIERNPALLICDRRDLTCRVMEAARLGLMLGDRAYLVPRRDGSVKLRATYRGLVSLIRQQPSIAVIFADTVCSRDLFAWNEATGEFTHEEADEDRGKPIRYYARVKWQETGTWETDVVDADEYGAREGPDTLGLKLVLLGLCRRVGLVPARGLTWEAAGL